VSVTIPAIPSNPKLTAGNILCGISIGLIVLLIVGNSYLPESTTSTLNYLGVVATVALCIGASLRGTGKQEQRADFNIALQRQLQQEKAPGMGVQTVTPTYTAPAQYQNPSFHAVNPIAKDNPNFQVTSDYEEDPPSGFVTCPACGKENDSDHAFCTSCGAKLQ